MTHCAVQLECGGCPMMGLSANSQRTEKIAHVERCMATFGLELPEVGFVPSPRAVGYRNRIRLRIEPGGRVRFFNENKATTCAVLEPGLRARLEEVLEASRVAPEVFAPFAHLELRSDDLRGVAGLALHGAATPPSLEGFLVGLRGDPEIPCQERPILESLSTFVPLDGFLQVNTMVNAALAAAVRDGTRARGVRTALDLFAGSGNFSVPLAAAGVRVTAVEAHGPSVRALAEASRQQALEIEAIAERASEACERLAKDGREFELVVVDAPRAGARDAIEALLATRPRAVALCSCNPVTLARDTAELVRAGFVLEGIQLFDMFPQTRHVEVLAWLTRRV